MGRKLRRSGPTAGVSVKGLLRCERPTRFGDFRRVGVRVFPQLEESAVFGARGVAISGLLEQPRQPQQVARPPSPDRPASITLLVFDNGVFLGTNLLIRSDPYHGQPCKSTGNPYRFIARIGYYECLHQSQAN
jgi:hypothetical protein